MAPFDLVKQHKSLYAPSAKHPAIVEVPEFAFLMVDGRGDPNTSEAYQQSLEALYSVAYTLKFSLKKADPERDFKVAPLEGLWWADEGAPSLAELQHDRDAWNWTMMIAVPDEVTAEEVAAAADAAARKRELPAAALLRLGAPRGGPRRPDHAHRPLRGGGADDRTPPRLRRRPGLRAPGSPPRDLPRRPPPRRPRAAQDGSPAPGPRGLACAAGSAARDLLQPPRAVSRSAATGRRRARNR